MLKKIIALIEEIPVTFSQWLIGISSILLVRFLFEGISSPPPQIIGVDPDRLVQHYLFFITLGLLLGLVIALLLPQKRSEILRWIMFGMLITWLPPIFDFVTTHGQGSAMNYICAMPAETLFCYLTFFGPFTDPGITLGMRIEVLILLAAIFYYTKIHSQNILKPILAVLLCYTIVFIYFASPSFAAFALFKLPKITFLSDEQIHFFASQYISLIISGFFYIILFFTAAMWLYIVHKNKLIAILKNTRIERLIHYFLMPLAGAILAIKLTHPNLETIGLGILSFLALLPAIYSAWMFSVGVNDIVDISSDKISSPNRPLIVGTLSIEDIRAANLFFLIIALIGGYLAGPETLFFIAIFIIAYHIYSVPPLRLKKIPILSSFLIAIATLSVFMAGFYAFTADRSMRSLPSETIALILVVFTLASNIRDLKDTEGDRAAGIWTLPVIFGQKNGARIIGTLISLSFLLVPTFLRQTSLFLIAVPFALLSYLAVTQKNYREWHIFALYFAYAILCMIMI